MLARTQVDAVYALFAVLLTEHQYLFPFAVDGQITRHAECVKHGHVVLVNAVLSRMCHFTHYGDGQVHELDRHHRVFHQIIADQFLLDGSSLPP